MKKVIMGSVILLAGLIGAALATHNAKSYVYNVAYYDGVSTLVDEDGEAFIGDYDLAEGTYYVCYDSNKTVTRLDDVPVRFEKLD
jgi:hypothetical protein